MHTLLQFADKSVNSGAPDSLLGATIDQRYRVESVIGKGGMGVVYRAKHCVLGRPLALKVLREDLLSDKEMASRFIQEAHIAAKLAHPGIVEITDFGRLPDGRSYFVMEFLEGQSLRALVGDGAFLPLPRCLEIARQVAEALAHAHEHNVVHRDLKPDNIHVLPAGDRGDSIKLLDFGLARAAGAARLTQPGVILGTSYYLSPEQALGETADARSDLYALGVVLYEMVTGRAPFDGKTQNAILDMHVHTAPIPPSEYRAELAQLPEFEKVILRCLEKDPADRFESSHALLAALRLAGAGRGGAARHARSARAKRAGSAVLAALVAITACVIGLRLHSRARAAHAPEPVAAHAAVVNAPPEPAIQTDVPVSSPALVIEPPEIALPVTPSVAPSAAPAKRQPIAPHATRKTVPQKKSAATGGREIEDPWAK